METQNLQGNGAAYFLKDRLLENSDKYRCYVCDACGQFSISHKAIKTSRCPSCVNSKSEMIELPYAAKLLFQLLKGMGIVPRIII